MTEKSTKKRKLTEIADILGGIYDLKMTHGSYGKAYTAKRKNVPSGENQHRRVFIGWTLDQIIQDHHIGELGYDETDSGLKDIT